MYEELIKNLRCHQNKEGKPCLSCSCQQQQFCDTRHDTEAADALEDLITQLSALQSENLEKDEEIEKLRMQVRVKDACISGKSSIITHMETERDAVRPSAEVLEAIDELVEFARDRMSIGVWLGYVNVLNEWRGAQGGEYGY